MSILKKKELKMKFTEKQITKLANMIERFQKENEGKDEYGFPVGVFPKDTVRDVNELNVGDKIFIIHGVQPYSTEVIITGFETHEFGGRICFTECNTGHKGKTFFGDCGVEPYGTGYNNSNFCLKREPTSEEIYSVHNYQDSF